MLTLVYISYFLLFFIMLLLVAFLKDVVLSDGIESNQNDFDWCNELLIELQDSIITKIKKIKKEYKIFKNILYNKKIQYIAKVKKYSGYYLLLSLFV